MRIVKLEYNKCLSFSLWQGVIFDFLYPSFEKLSNFCFSFDLNKYIFDYEELREIIYIAPPVSRKNIKSFCLMTLATA